MKKVVSNILYVLFLAFALTLMIACAFLIFDCAGSKGQTYNDIEAVAISDSEVNESNYEPIDNKIYNNTANEYKLVKTRFGYEALAKDQKKTELYDKIANSVYRVTNEPDENGRFRTSRIRMAGIKMSEFDIREVVNAFICDNPEMFWIENLFGYAYVEDNTLVEFYSVLSSDECETYIDVFNNRIDEILAKACTGKTEYERERLIHDEVLKHCTYKTGVKGADDGWQYFSAYGALVDGEAVCEGYSKIMQVLLSRVGIPSGTIRGEADGVSHMWNVVELGGEWYHLDATWDDNSDDINYEYFNLTTEGIKKNHIISDSISAVINSLENSEDIDPLVKYNFYVPMCTSKKMNYYYAEGLPVNTFDSELNSALVQKLKDTANLKESFVPLIFGSEMTYSEYINKLFNEAPHEFYYAIESANMELDDLHKIDIESVHVLKNESEGTLRVRISYLSDKEKTE